MIVVKGQDDRKAELANGPDNRVRELIEDVVYVDNIWSHPLEELSHLSLGLRIPYAVHIGPSKIHDRRFPCGIGLKTPNKACLGVTLHIAELIGAELYDTVSTFTKCLIQLDVEGVGTAGRRTKLVYSHDRERSPRHNSHAAVERGLEQANSWRRRFKNAVRTAATSKRGRPACHKNGPRGGKARVMTLIATGSSPTARSKFPKLCGVQQ